MTAEPMPPVRATHVWHAPAGAWCYDVWGRHGRPVVLIPPVLFDRTIWWPAAADLRPHATVLAVDLPGHGQSAPRGRYDPDELVDDLACLIHSVDLRLAPVVVGHGSSASLAELFAARYATHAVVTVDAPEPAPVDTAARPRDVRSYLAGLCLDAVPPAYRDLVAPLRDPGLLAAYADCMFAARPAAPAGPAGRPARLVVHSRPPSSTRPPGTGPVAAPSRHEVYDVDGRFAHLTDVSRFAHDIRTLL